MKKKQAKAKEVAEEKVAVQEKVKEENYETILNNLKGRAVLKQTIYKEVCKVFRELLSSVETISGKLEDDVAKINEDVHIEFKELNQFESMLKFGSDVLIFSMHSNIFYVNPSHYIHKLHYLKEDPSRAYCGVIHIHNFLADSIKYNRMDDMGYLIARIFINKEKHFFIEGKGQLAFLYEDFSMNVFDKPAIDNIVELAINHSIEFDLLAPDFEQIKAITLMNKQLQYGNSGYQTDKQLGYKFKAEYKNK